MPANRRWNAKRDTSEKSIVEALEKAGYTVYRELPVDLLLWHPSYGEGWYRTLECKTPVNGKLPKDKRRKAQQAFIQLTGCRVAGTPESAISALQEG